MERKKELRDKSILNNRFLYQNHIIFNQQYLNTISKPAVERTFDGFEFFNIDTNEHLTNYVSINFINFPVIIQCTKNTYHSFRYESFILVIFDLEVFFSSYIFVVY